MSKQLIQKNVLGEKLEACSEDPITGWYRDGCCNTDNMDHGVHTVCAKVTTKCLEWAKINGNDLIRIFNISPSPVLGNVLQSIQRAQVLGEIKTSKEAKDLAEKLLRS